VRVLIAPDKFKGALSAVAAAEAIAEGVRQARPHTTLDLCPMGDGGDGTAALLGQRGGFEIQTCRVLDPLARPRSARWWRHATARAAIVELADASGLQLLTPSERNPLQTTTYGTGQLMQTALEAGCTALTLCVGGSATVDGGAGIVQAMGCALYQRDTPLDRPACAADLSRIDRLLPPPHRHFGLRILCDVDNPLLGERGAARTFGPQKGASAADVETLELGLAHWADVLASATGVEVREIPHGGAAGGVPAALHAVFRAAPVPGAMAFAHEFGLLDRLTDCDLCLTGEGCLDAGTTGGKVVATVARLAAARGVACVALTGAIRPRDTQDPDALTRALNLTAARVINAPGTDHETALATAYETLRTAAFELISAWPPTPVSNIPV
jgi:glycerate kinase